MGGERTMCKTFNIHVGRTIRSIYDWIRLYAHCDTTRSNFLSAILRNADKGVGIALDELIESNNMTQLIDQPTNLESRGISCVDLIITDQPNLFIDYGIHS